MLRADNVVFVVASFVMAVVSVRFVGFGAELVLEVSVVFFVVILKMIVVGDFWGFLWVGFLFWGGKGLEITGFNYGVDYLGGFLLNSFYNGLNGFVLLNLVICLLGF